MRHVVESLLISAATLVCTACCSDDDAADADFLLPSYQWIAPSPASPGEDLLTKLFYQLHPELRGQELVIQYGIARLGYIEDGKLMRHSVGKAHVNTRARHKQRLEHPDQKGEHSLRVLYDLETGNIIWSNIPLQKK